MGDLSFDRTRIAQPARRDNIWCDIWLNEGIVPGQIEPLQEFTIPLGEPRLPINRGHTPSVYRQVSTAHKYGRQEQTL